MEAVVKISACRQQIGGWDICKTRNIIPGTWNVQFPDSSVITCFPKQGRCHAFGALASEALCMLNENPSLSERLRAAGVIV